MACVPETSKTTLTQPSNPWGKKAEVHPLQSFTSVMDEEYAQQLEQEELAKQDSLENEIQSESACLQADTGYEVEVHTTDSDLLLAQMLQLEFDKENDAYIHAQEKQVNGSNKVTMSYRNFCLTHPYDTQTEDKPTTQETWVSSEEDEDDDEDFYWADEMSNANQEQKRVVTSKKVSGPGAKIITKHDAQICGKRNAENVERFPPGFHAGDISDMSLSNKVYNKLKMHSMREERAGAKVHEKKEHSTHEHALDENTRLILYKMVNSGMLDSLSGIISTGKEAVVIHSRGGQTADKPLPSECAIKVFKTTLNEFRTREKYISDDHRFRHRFTKQNPRKVIRLWAEKEFRNLKRMWDAGLSCPEPVCLRKQILVMKFIGKDQNAAPKLKDAVLSKSQYKQAYAEVTEVMRRMYVDCNLIHADMSEYNILWHEDKCWIIDVSQSIEPAHEHALHFLYRDCQNITGYFEKTVGLTDLMSVSELFTFVCGKQLDGEKVEALEQEVQEFESNKYLMAYGIDTKPYAFDYQFSKSEKERESTVTDRTGHLESEQSLNSDQVTDSNAFEKIQTDSTGSEEVSNNCK